MFEKLRQILQLLKEEGRWICCRHVQYLLQALANRLLEIHQIIRSGKNFTMKISNRCTVYLPRKQLWPTINFLSDESRSITCRNPIADLIFNSAAFIWQSLTSSYNAKMRLNFYRLQSIKVINRMRNFLRKDQRNVSFRLLMKIDAWWIFGICSKYERRCSKIEMRGPP